MRKSHSSACRRRRCSPPTDPPRPLPPAAPRALTFSDRPCIAQPRQATRKSLPGRCVRHSCRADGQSALYAAPFCHCGTGLTCPVCLQIGRWNVHCCPERLAQAQQPQPHGATTHMCCLAAALRLRGQETALELPAAGRTWAGVAPSTAACSAVQGACRLRSGTPMCAHRIVMTHGTQQSTGATHPPLAMRHLAAWHMAAACYMPAKQYR